jgi:hypothetical protein
MDNKKRNILTAYNNRNIFGSSRIQLESHVLRSATALEGHGLEDLSYY